MGDHAFLSPSAADRWTVCTAAPEACKDLPNVSSSYADEGTKAHELLERAVKAHTAPILLEPDNPAAPHVQLAYDLAAPHLADQKSLVLSEVKAKYNDLCYGTVDLVIVAGGHLTIIDLKYGQGKLVEADCKQMLVYAVATLNSLDFMFLEPVTQVTRTVVQPRAAHQDGPIRSVTSTTEDTLQEFNERILPAMLAVEAGITEFVASEEGCQWCPKKNALEGCPAFQQQTLEKVQSYFSPAGALVVPVAEDVRGYSVNELAAILEARDLLRMLITTVEDRATMILQSSGGVPGFKLVEGKSNRKWAIEEEKELADFLLKELKLKKQEIYVEKLVGIPAVEKLIDPKARNGKAKYEKLQSIIVKPKGKPTLVKDTNPKPAITGFFQDQTLE